MVVSMSKIKRKLTSNNGNLAETFSQAEQRDLMARAMAEYEVHSYTLIEALEELTELRTTKWYYDENLYREYERLFK